MSTEPLASIEAVAEQLADLRELFRRRLLDDKAKNQLAQALQMSLEARDALDRGEAFGSLFQELLLALERLTSQEPSVELNRSVHAELLEAMARRGLRVIAAEGEVNTRVHEVVGIGQTAEQHAGDLEAQFSALPAGTPLQIVSVQRDGYLLGERLLRPARVLVAPASPQPEEQPRGTTEDLGTERRAIEEEG